MSTGVVYAKFTNKGIAGFTDFSTRLLGALRTSHIDSVKARFDVDGVFNTPHTLSAGGNDIVQVNGSDRSTDGLGHTLQIASAEGGNSALFENAVGIVYDVGARYAEIPVGISVNPRTGLPDYSATKEEIGESGAPDLVTDNGSTITFRVDTITESGVSNAGRTVRVYKLVPAAGATTEAIAIEDCTVVWTGSNNQITTTGLLGQTTVSTTASDYVVVMLGITVKRNTNLESSGNHLFIGQVTGVGAGSPPTVFDVSQQRLLKTFVDASQVAFTPYSWLTNTSVQNALQQVVDVLGDSGTSNPGAVRIGVNVVPFGKALPTAAADPAGGIGNLADSTFTAPVDLQDALAGIDAALRKRRAWTATFAGVRTGGGDISAINLVDNGVGVSTLAVGGLFLLQRATSTYVYANAASPTLANAPIVVGEEAGDTTGSGRASVNLTQATADVPFAGEWKRLNFTTTVGSNAASLGVKGNLQLDDCAFEHGVLKLLDVGVDNRVPLLLRRTRVQGVSYTGEGAASLTIGGVADDGVFWGVIEGCFFDSVSSTTAVVQFLDISSVMHVNTDIHTQRVLLFKNCHFQSTHDVPFLNEVSAVAGFRLAFENCTFLATGAGTTRMLDLDLGHVTFNGCYFDDRRGRGIKIAGIVQGCRFEIAGQDVTTQNVFFSSGSGGLRMNDCVVQINDQPPSTAANVVSIGSENWISNTLFRMANSEELGQSVGTPLFDFNGSTLNNVQIDLNGMEVGTNVNDRLVEIDNCRANNLFVRGLPDSVTSASASQGRLLRVINQTKIDGLTVDFFFANEANSSGGLQFLDSHLSRITVEFSTTLSIANNPTMDFERCTVSGLVIDNSANPSARFKTTTNPGLRFIACTVNGVVWTEALQDASGQDMVVLDNDGSDTWGGSFTNSRLQGGDSTGTFQGNVLSVVGDHWVVSGNVIEWSPPDDNTANSAIQISGADNSFNVNTVHKDLTGGSATSANTAIDDTGTSNDTALTHFSAA